FVHRLCARDGATVRRRFPPDNRFRPVQLAERRFAWRATRTSNTSCEALCDLGGSGAPNRLACRFCIGAARAESDDCTVGAYAQTRAGRRRGPMLTRPGRVAVFSMLLF